jgi:hypothetical protein
MFSIIICNVLYLVRVWVNLLLSLSPEAALHSTPLPYMTVATNDYKQLDYIVLIAVMYISLF